MPPCAYRSSHLILLTGQPALILLHAQLLLQRYNLGLEWGNSTSGQQSRGCCSGLKKVGKLSFVAETFVLVDKSLFFALYRPRTVADWANSIGYHEHTS